MTGRQFRVDRGGPITDIVARPPGGRPLIHKLLSDNPARYADVADVRELLDVSDHEAYGDGIRAVAVVGVHSAPERRLPVHLDESAVRPGGGAGRWGGGAGAVRPISLHEPMTVSTPSRHRRIPPYGMAAVAPGALGSNRLERADGGVVELGGSDSADAGPGDVLVIETPGGGGYGPPPHDNHPAGEETDDPRAL